MYTSLTVSGTHKRKYLHVKIVLFKEHTFTQTKLILINKSDIRKKSMLKAIPTTTRECVY